MTHNRAKALEAFKSVSKLYKDFEQPWLYPDDEKTIIEALTEPKWKSMDSAPKNRTEILVACWLPPISDDDCGMWGYDVVAYQAKDYPPTECGWLLSGHGGEENCEVFPSFWREIPDPLKNKTGYILHPPPIGEKS